MHHATTADPRLLCLITAGIALPFLIAFARERPRGPFWLPRIILVITALGVAVNGFLS